MLVHIDCNSYFASCEVATRPELAGTPVVVTTSDANGGGVILALNAEAKALGLKRGVPLFKVRDLLKANSVNICTADHRKYRSISRKIMETVQQQGIVLDMVQYSVDEFFGSMPIDEPDELRRYVGEVKDEIARATGIPVGCGCACTYTLAKVATYYAKHYKGYGGVCILTADHRERALSLLPVGEVWGIGRQNRKHLEALGIRTALDLAQCSEKVITATLNTAGVRTWLELRGQPAITFESHSRQKSIMQSRTFGVMITEREALAKELTAFASRCATTLRNQHGLCSTVTVFIGTNRFRQDLWQYHNDAACRLSKPTADTSVILKTVKSLLDNIFRQGYHYKRAGVILGGITPDEGHQLDLFTVEVDERRRRLMQVADSINQRFGASSVSFGGE